MRDQVSNLKDLTPDIEISRLQIKKLFARVSIMLVVLLLKKKNCQKEKILGVACKYFRRKRIYRK